MPKTRLGQFVNKGEDGELVVDWKVNRRSKKKKTKTTSPIKFMVGDVWHCKKCNVPSSSEDDNEEKWLECDRCTCQYHVGCTTLKAQHFHYLHATPHESIKWFCEECKEQPNLSDTIAQTNSKVDKLFRLVETLVVENSALKEQNKKIMDMLEKKTNKKEEEVIKKKFEEVVEDHSEKEEKKKNIIIFNVPECAERGKEETEDLKFVQELVNFVNPSVKKVTEASKVVRIGWKKTGGPGEKPNPRPLKVTLNTVEDKASLLKDARRLKNSDRFHKVGMAYEKTRKELVEYRELKDELKKKNDENDGVEYVIFRGKITKKSDIQAKFGERLEKNQGVGEKGKSSNGAQIQ